MFNNISWSSYFSIIAAITVIYYFLMAVIFYRNEITKIIFSGNLNLRSIPAKAKRESSIINSGKDSEEKYISDEKEDAIQSSIVHELINELNKVFKKSSEKKFLKEELIVALQLTLKNYLLLKSGPFCEAINSLIELESQSQCSIYLNEDEMELLWKER